MTFQIKVTSPEKFRVNSHIGLVAPMGFSEINIKVADGKYMPSESNERIQGVSIWFSLDFAKSFNHMMANERFIILSKPIGRDEIVENLRDYWSSLNSSSPGVRQNKYVLIIPRFSSHC